jgi:60 kDa SS-A/Ro ribonucleoprotein
MANKALFASTRGKTAPDATTTNEAGGLAYARTPKNALAQLAATGTLGDAFYANAESQLADVLGYLNSEGVTPEYAAKVALYASERAYMKDMPALICAWLRNQGAEGVASLDRIFPRVITNGRMLRNFVQILRSGTTGKHKSIKGAAKRLVNTWLKNRKDWALFKDSVGNDPSLADIVKMSRPKAGKSERAALYGYLIGKVKADDERLPDFIRQYEAFKVDSKNTPVPNVEFRMLSGMDLTKEQWAEIAKRGAFHQTRMNLNNYARHGVFKVKGMVEEIAAKLRDPESIQKAKVFPYQLMSAYLATTGGIESRYGGYYGYGGSASKPQGDVPTEITEALQDALEASTANVPSFGGKVLVGLDVSGSMHSPVTGNRGAGQTTSVMCVDVAALFASIIMRQNKSADILGFTTSVHQTNLNPRDTVITNAKTLRKLPSGGTDCSQPLQDWNRRKVKGDLVVIISDSESWADTTNYRRRSWGGGSGLMNEWESFKARNPKAKLVCIDLQPYGSAQALDRDDILLVGGFSDSVFDIVRLFAEGRLSAENWVSEIEKTEL